jgi:hypothetical protein
MHARAAETLSDATRGVAPRAQKQLVAILEQIKQNLIAAETTAVSTLQAGTPRHGRANPGKPLSVRA